ncbi:hypothetical protein RHSIM_Rhsim08G0074100 [Rhododendron simsii]|uniref:BAG domain-containing protein n=1 Tax=Rhododendron simsii TaxID=118357 RepID=A0A834GN73_RHOSS|nr:hypothetical protein RHSIM_Rhsim08G0074100 [Rhododendron simsii]
MASHHHHHCPPPAATSYCCCHYSTYYTPPPPPDPHLHSPPSHFHHHPPPPQPQPHHHSPHLNPLHEPFPHHNPHQTPHPPPQQTHQDFQPTVSSLLRRIATLESSLLRRQFPFNSNPPSSRSLRDAAARTIQTHFRAFLVRRSRTLRQLKDLAAVKSALNALKTSFNQDTQFDSQAISRRAANLLLKLDSIQGGDPMIRDGKRSIIREIIRFMELIDEVAVKRCEISSLALKNTIYRRTGGNKIRVIYTDERVLGEKKLGGRVEKIHGFSGDSDYDRDDEEGIEVENPRIPVNGKAGYSHNRNGGFVKTPAKVKKSVSFAENGNVYKVFATTRKPVSRGDTNSSDGSDSADNEIEILDNLCRGVEEIKVLPKGNEADEEVNSEDGGSPHSSDGGRNPRRNLRDEDSYEVIGHYQGENEEFTFSTPHPVKMESRADLVKNRKSLKIVE